MAAERDRSVRASRVAGSMICRYRLRVRRVGRGDDRERVVPGMEAEPGDRSRCLIIADSLPRLGVEEETVPSPSPAASVRPSGLSASAQRTNRPSPFRAPSGAAVAHEHREQAGAGRERVVEGDGGVGEPERLVEAILVEGLGAESLRGLDGGRAARAPGARRARSPRRRSRRRAAPRPRRAAFAGGGWRGAGARPRARSPPGSRRGRRARARSARGRARQPSRAPRRAGRRGRARRGRARSLATRGRRRSGGGEGVGPRRRPRASRAAAATREAAPRGRPRPRPRRR